MSTEKVEEKEKKIKKKEVTYLEKDKQDKLRTFSKITYILARIAKVFMIIGVVGVAIAMILAPVLVKNIKIKNNTIEVFGEKIEYKENNGKIDLSIKGENVGSLTSDEKVEFDHIISELEKTNITKVFTYLEIVLALSIVTLFVYYFMLKHVDKLFTNIHDLDTPFNSDNLEHTKKIAFLSLIVLIVSFVSDLLSSAYLDNSNVSINLTSVVTVLILYAVSYLFEYACILQKDSKATIYSEIDE